MHEMDDSTENRRSAGLSRRKVLQGTAATAIFISGIGRSTTAANAISRKDQAMSPKAFVYTELQISLPLAEAPWREINKSLLQQSGLLNKTWLAGVGNESIGGLYAFDRIANAQAFVTGFFPGEARKFGVGQTTRIFDAEVVAEASRDIGSAHFGAGNGRTPGAFVYTEVQVSVPFDQAPWRERNPVLKQQKGLLGKTWLSGLHTKTLGGLDAFDTIENARAFALVDFPAAAARMNAAFYTRVFDGAAVAEASREMRSPFFV